MTDASEIQQAFRVLEKHAEYSAEVLEMLKSRVLSRFAVADRAHDAGSVSGGPQTSDPRRTNDKGRQFCELSEARAQARGACQSAIRAGLRAAFVHDHLDACKPRT